MKWSGPALLALLVVVSLWDDPLWLMIPYTIAAFAFFGALIFGILFPFALRAIQPYQPKQPRFMHRLIQFVIGPDG
ncbi:hypothetical protein POI8812_00795 [Pontivivens insulae]|uniref:Uncharacterized protein n=2 Tax=Pontivivens insulae TaxID=1639689 RepID=A0A2R8A8E2_9RHOB|nr:hypothetical protein DFR53_0794 [Pontivivens insulae]SPF28494.1 hypothetical protein POI8812_00795 [Pontivivens insulae]